MKASVLCIYNEGSQPGTPYIGAKGFSLLIDVDGDRTIFGTGLRGRYLIHNMDHLDIDADSIDRIVISHDHADHAMGVSALLSERTQQVPIYAPSEAWGRKGRFSKNGIRLTKNAIPNSRRIDVDGWARLSKHLFLTPPVPGADTHETFAVIIGDSRPILISGCCHCGVETVFDMVRDKFGANPKTLIGGLHMENMPKDKAYETADILQNAECQDLHLNHCTGPKGALRLREKLSLKGVNEYIVGDRLEYELGLIKNEVE